MVDLLLSLHLECVDCTRWRCFFFVRDHCNIWWQH